LFFIYRVVRGRLAHAHFSMNLLHHETKEPAILYDELSGYLTLCLFSRTIHMLGCSPLSVTCQQP
jgi:hypothetical protein